MITTAAPCSATVPVIAGSKVRPETSLIISAPSLSIASATRELEVSIDTGMDGAISLQSSNAGLILSSWVPGLTPSAPGRVDSPPMSMMSAPSALTRRIRSFSFLREE